MIGSINESAINKSRFSFNFKLASQRIMGLSSTLKIWRIITLVTALEEDSARGEDC